LDSIQIEILDSVNSVEGILEVGDVKNFPLALTNGIADLRKIENKSGSFSTSFKIPSTKNNDDLLEHIYLSTQRNYKDMDAEKDCRIRVNGIDIEHGKIRITRIRSGGRNKSTDYSFKFFGNNMDWVLAMRGKTMQDLPYLDDTFTYSSANLISSWSNIGGTEDVVFALMNRGQRQISNEVNVKDMRPDYFVLDVLNNAFKSVGYNFESTHFNTATNKKLILSYFGDNFKQADRQTLNHVLAKLDSSVTNFDTTFSHSTSLSFNDIANITGLIVSTCNTFTTHAASAPNSGGGINCASESDTGTYIDTPAPLKDNNNNFASNKYTVPFDGLYSIGSHFDHAVTFDQSAAAHFRSIKYQVKITRGAGVSI